MKNREKILLYCTQLMPTGGIESHILEFCKTMSNFFDIDILVANFRMDIANERKLRENCKNVYLIKSNSAIKRHFLLLLNLLRLFKTKYDVLYTNGNGSSVLLLGKIVRLKKWVLHHHMEAEPEVFNSLDKNYKKALSEATTIIACSKINAKNLKEQLNRDIDVVYCFSRDLGCENSEEHKDNKLHFGYFGRLIHAKGIDLICKLSQDKECDNISFHLWGNGNEYPKEFFQKFNNVFYHGIFNSTKELRQIINYLDAFLLLTSHPEGLPVALLEVMSAGLPWISTNKGGIPDITCDPVSTRIIDISEYETVKNSVLRLADDIRRGIVTKEKQIENYKKHFSADVLTERWCDIFHTQN